MLNGLKPRPFLRYFVSWSEPERVRTLAWNESLFCKLKDGKRVVPEDWVNPSARRRRQSKQKAKYVLKDVLMEDVPVPAQDEMEMGGADEADNAGSDEDTDDDEVAKLAQEMRDQV